MSVQLVPQSFAAATATDSVRLRMIAARCVFDFTVRECRTADVSVGEVYHRSLLAMLFDEVQARADRGWQWQMARNSDLKTGRRWIGGEDAANASATRWDASGPLDVRVLEPVQCLSLNRKLEPSSSFQQLQQAFENPPSSIRCPPGLFAEFCATTGLLPNHGIEVLDWAGDPFKEPGRSNWSKYFEDGKEWWGIWCLTVWNPRYRTLAALAASATD